MPHYSPALWPVPGTPVDPDFDIYAAGEDLILATYESAPCIFLFLHRGERRLAYCCGDDRATRTLRFLVVPIPDAELDMLLSNDLDLIDALVKSPAWVVDQGYGGETLRAWYVDARDIPSRVLPGRGVTLYRRR